MKGFFRWRTLNYPRWVILTGGVKNITASVTRSQYHLVREFAYSTREVIFDVGLSVGFQAERPDLKQSVGLNSSRLPFFEEDFRRKANPGADVRSTAMGCASVNRDLVAGRNKLRSSFRQKGPTVIRCEAANVAIFAPRNESFGSLTLFASFKIRAP